ncbi:farnesylcysteine lyase-like [Tasmannia lanceolata]|uniref:farnesylcysteine lyase-like n=1 Tax=Tasmannia lanceolata TaxID=3420 RepID=UPI0040641A4D
MEERVPSLPLLLLFFFLFSTASSSPIPKGVCIIGSGIGGSSVAHFLKKYSTHLNTTTLLKDITILEKNKIVGGRMATVTISGDTFEAGGSILRQENLHAYNFATSLNLKIKTYGSNSSSSSSLIGIWNGTQFVTILNTSISQRYGNESLIRTRQIVQKAVESFSLYYTSLKSRPVFSTVEEMLKWSGLYGLTQKTLQEELADALISQRFISEYITIITRIMYGQNVTISGLAGTVSIAGSEGVAWSVEGGNWQIAAGMIGHSNVSLNLNEDITSISYVGGSYELNSTKGNSYCCKVAIVATPLDELNITFSPPISIPKRKLQQTYVTFVRGLWNPAYFGLNSLSEMPHLVGTIEAPDLPFSSISIQRFYSQEDMVYKIFSRTVVTDELLDLIFSVRNETVQINWAAYPHYQAPEVFAPFVLDGHHLYYINSFESAASTIECSAIAAENVARLILSRLSSAFPSDLPNF